MKEQEPLSVVVLTKDEEHNLPECLDALLPQLEEGDEVVVVDSASKDATVTIARRYAGERASQVVVEAFEQNVSFGRARNAGIARARNDVIVMLSADATPDMGWLVALRRALANADVVYGRQRHAPTTHNVATVSRGLRYHHFESGSAALPETYASNVNAAYRRAVFETIQFDESAQGSEDVAFARAARLAGLRIAYARDAVVRHKDASSWRAEWRKHAREGAAAAQLRTLIGAPKWHLAWAVSVAGLALIAIVAQDAIVLAGLALVFFAPTLRRLRASVARNYKPHHLAGGVLVSPFFDLAFITSYLSRRFRA